MSVNQRQTKRIDISKLAFAKEGGQAHGGLLKDISVAGAYIEFYYPLGRVEHGFEVGDAIELLLDNESLLTGSAVRIHETGIALQFNADNAAQKAILESLIAAEGIAAEGIAGSQCCLFNLV